MKIDKYLDKLNEQEGEQFIITLIQILVPLFLTIIILYFSVKKNSKLTEKITKITKRNYVVYEVPISEPNAFCFGGFGNHIFVTKGLLNLLNEDEILAVCLHEAGHITTFDVVQNLAVSLSSTWVAKAFIESSSKFLLKTDTPLLFSVKVIFAFILVVLLSASPIIILGKINEYRADKYSVKFGYGKHLASSLTKLQKYVDEEHVGENAFMKSIRKVSNFLDVHPSTKNRVDRLLKNVELYKAISKRNISGVKTIVSDTIGG